MRRTNPSMPPKNISQKVIFTYSFIVALGSILMMSAMFLSPSEPGISIIFGFSLSRLILAGGFLLAFVFFAALSWKAIHDQIWADRFLEQLFGGGVSSKVLAWLAGIGL